MKKSKLVISFSLLAGVLSVGVLVNTSLVKRQTVYAEESTANTPVTISEPRYYTVPAEVTKRIPIETLIPSLPDGSEYKNSDAVYWAENYTYFAIDGFYDSVDHKNNDSVYTIKWEQHSPYFVYQWGAANNSFNRYWVEGQGEVFEERIGIRVHYFDLNDSPIKRDGQNVTQFIENDTHTGNGMVLRFHQVDNYVFDNYTGGFKISLELVDHIDGNGGYAYHLFGYLLANQTEGEVNRELTKFYYTTVPDRGGNVEGDMKDRIRGHYYLNGNLQRGMAFAVDSIDGSFESNELFQANWFYDVWYKDRRDTDHVKHFDKVIATSTYRSGTNMPFNKEGNGFFRGWYEPTEDEGFVQADEPKYRFLSQSYKLNDNQHYVSIKMAGTASLHVIDALTGNDLAWIDNRALKYDLGNDSDEWIHKGFNTCTMRRHVINLSAFAGRTVRFAIADWRDYGWGAAYFDAFDCNYDITKGFRVDSIIQDREGLHYSSFTDIYVNSNHIETDNNGVKYTDAANAVADETPAKIASDFIKEYYSYARKDQGLDLCSIRTSEEMKNILNKYLAFNADVKAIIDVSDDYEHDNDETKDEQEVWHTVEVKISSLGWNLQYLCQENNLNYINKVLFSGLNIRLQENGNFIVIPAVVIAVGLIAFLGFYLNKKRKKTN